ncbi:MAG: RNA 2',3'-cyclic phosphodiesterase, partial [Dehalococcoidia bacterium]|nr:RNA 2',3'-cyclic phosphodiesterase [Dehalococcoidia bacterium]
MSHSPEQIRSFIAIELPEEAKEGLARLKKELERDEHKFVKWVEPRGIHLTLKFLGNIPSKQVAEITEAIEGAAQRISPFHLEIGGLGAFPSLRQARVFWVGIGGEVEKLSRLQQNIDYALAAQGFAKEERSFVPHLTLARIRQGASPLERRSFGELVGSTIFEDKYDVKVESISLMRSQLTPAGAIYTCLSL